MSPKSRLQTANTTFVQSHPLRMRLIHWLVAILIISALIMSTFVMSTIPDDSPEKIDALRRHISAGATVLILTILRMVVRRSAVKPDPKCTGMAWADRLAKLVHRGFDVMILAMIASGIGMALLGGIFPVVMGIENTLPGSLSSLPLLWLHRSIGSALSACLILHVAGALYHQLILRDGILSRMLFKQPVKAAD